MMNVKKFILAATAVLTMSLSSSAWTNEHRFCAYAAHFHLTPTTLATLERWIDMSIADYAQWMDWYRKDPRYSNLLTDHVIRAEKDCTLIGRPDERGEGVLHKRIEASIGVLQNWRNLPDSTVLDHIKFLCHAVPEIHCPGHYYYAEIKAHTFQINYKGERKISYHQFWDNYLFYRFPKYDLEQYRALIDIMDAGRIAQVRQGTPTQWAMANARKMKQIYDWAGKGTLIDDAWIEEHLPFVQECLAEGCYRLAHVLNMLFDPKYKG